MPHIRTIEDDLQYQANIILNKFAKDYDITDEFKRDADAAAWKYRKEIGSYFLDTLSEYCGIQDAFNKKD